MTATINVELDSPCEATDFVLYLAARGLSAAQTPGQDCCRLEVEFAAGEDERLRQAFEKALGSWLAETGKALVPVAGGEHDYVLRPPGD